MRSFTTERPALARRVPASRSRVSVSHIMVVQMDQLIEDMRCHADDTIMMTRTFTLSVSGQFTCYQFERRSMQDGLSGSWPTSVDAISALSAYTSLSSKWPTSYILALTSSPSPSPHRRAIADLTILWHATRLNSAAQPLTLSSRKSE